MRQFIVSYNKSFRTMRSLPMRCMASGTFASSNMIDVKHEPDDVYNYSVRYRRVVSANSITHSGSVIYTDVGLHGTSNLNSMWNATSQQRNTLICIRRNWVCITIYMFCVLVKLSLLWIH